MRHRQTLVPRTAAPEDRASDPPSAAAARALLVGPARDFLLDRHGESTWRALRQGFFGGLSDGEMQRLPLLPEPLQLAIHERAADWLLSEGVLETPAGPQAAFDLVLGAEGPALGAEARAWLGALAAAALRLYRVGARTPDGHLCLRAALGSEPRLRRVEDDPATTFGLRRGELVAARVVHWRGGDVVAGAVYPFPGRAARLLESAGREAGALGPPPQPPGHPDRAGSAAEGERLVELYISQAMTWLWLQGAVGAAEG